MALVSMQRQSLRNEFKKFRQEVINKRNKMISCEIQNQFFEMY